MCVHNINNINKMVQLNKTKVCPNCHKVCLMEDVQENPLMCNNCIHAYAIQNCDRVMILIAVMSIIYVICKIANIV